MKTRTQNKKTIKLAFQGVPLRSFLLCWLCVLLPVLTMAGVTGARGYRADADRYAQEAQDSASSLLTYVSTRFSYAFTAGSAITTARWYQHYLNIANLYAAEFDSSVRADLIRQFSRTISTLDYVFDIMLIVPINDMVLCSRGWMAFDLFDKTYGHTIQIHAEAGENISPEITLLDTNLFGYRIPDGNSRYKQSALYILFSRSALARGLAPMLPKHFDYAQLSFNDTCVWESGAPPENGLTISVSDDYPRLTLTASLPTFHDVYLGAQLRGVLVWLVLYLIATCALAFALTKLILLPIFRLIRGKVPLQEKQGPLEALHQVIDQNAQLKSRNEEISRYFSSLQSEILFGLLSNPDVYHEDDPVREALPWLPDGLPCLIVIGCACADAMVPAPVHRVNVHLPDGACCVLWFADDPAAHAAVQWMERQLGVQCVSSVIHNPGLLQDAFASLYDAFHREHRTGHGLPLSLMNELYGHLTAGKESECAALLARARAQHPLAAFEHLLRLFARENGAPASELNGEWGGVEACMHSLCQAVRSSHLEDSRRTAGALCAYIEENYANPHMSIKLLCEEFTIGRTLISRLVKEHTGQTFYEYLTELRMKRACELLRQDDSITAIAEHTGYLSYITFKRAFTRRYGVSPRVWREGCLKGAE